MLWKTSFAVIFSMAGGLIWAETAAPLEWKPSVVLRASTGELPTRNLDLALAAERQKLLDAEQEIAKAQAEAAVLQHADEYMNGFLIALRERVIEAQSQIQSIQIR